MRTPICLQAKLPKIKLEEHIMDIGKILMIAFCVLCFAGMICAEIFVSRDEKKALHRKHPSDQDDNDADDQK